VRWTRCLRLLGAAVAGCLLAAPPVVAGEASGGAFELTGVVVAETRAEASSGGEFELTGDIRGAPLRVYGGEYSLGVSAGIDTKVLSSCECLCWGMGAIFLDGFESGGTGEWSLTVP